MKRLLCLLLTMMFLLGTVSALADSVAQEVVPVEILISGSRPMNEYTEMTRQQVIKDIGVDMNLTESSEFSTALSLRMADDDLPDLVWLSYSEWAAYAADGAWADLSPYLNAEDYPNLMAFVSDDCWAYMAVDEEGIYGIPNMTGVKTYYVLNVRQDWLDKLNLKAPTTLEEYTDVMRAFTFNDPDGNGENDTYGLCGPGYTYLSPFLGAFGATAGEAYFLNDDGTITTNVISENYRNGLAYLRDIYKEGLIDQETFTASASQAYTKFARGEFGIYSAWWSATGNCYAKYDMATLSPDAQVEILELPAGENGETGTYYSAAFNQVLAVSHNADEKTIRAALKLLDYNATSYGWRTLKYGVEDEFFTYDKETDKLTWKWGIPWGENGALTTKSGYEVTDMEVYCLLYNEALQGQPHKLGTTESDRQYDIGHDMILKENVKENIFALLTSEEKNTFGTDTKNYQKQCMIAFVTGTMDLDTEWDEYVNKYLSMGGEAIRQSLLVQYNEIMGAEYTFAE